MAGQANVGFCVVSGQESERIDDGNVKKKQKTHGRVEDDGGNDRLTSKNLLGANQKPMTELDGRAHKNSTIKIESRGTEPSVVDRTCHISRLPPEILSKIFSHIWWWKDIFKYGVVRESSWKALRRVCKSWYNILSHYVSLEISSSRNLQWASEYLVNSPFEWLDLSFSYDPYSQDELFLEDIPTTLWERIGAKICELHFCHVQLGNKVMKNVITNCVNLQTLTVTLKALNMNYTFCLPKMLERLEVEQKNLQTLKIVIDHIHGSDSTAIIKYNFRTWKRIFTALIRIFPNIICFRSSSGYSFDLDGWRKFFDCSFSKDSKEIMDRTSVAECLAYALSDNPLDWNRAIEALNRSNLRLTAIEFHYSRSRYMENCKSALLHFFCQPKTLEIG